MRKHNNTLKAHFGPLMKKYEWRFNKNNPSD